MDNKQGKRGNFFQIDRSVLPILNKLGVNALVAYLVLARGSSADNVRTSWSVNAIEKKTGIGRISAKVAVNKLQQAGIIEKVKLGKKPSYALKGANTPDDWIWLPNSLIDGAGNEDSPIEKLRRLQDEHILELFIGLYAMQCLPEYGGIHWSVFSFRYNRRKIWETGEFVIWGFNGKCNTANLEGALQVFMDRVGNDWDRMWKAWNTLVKLGLLETSTHLVESLASDAGIIYPAEDLPLPEFHEFPTVALSGTDAQNSWLDHDYIFAAPNWFPKAELVDVYRLKYRPHTAMSAGWIAKRSDFTKYAEWMDERLKTITGVSVYGRIK